MKNIITLLTTVIITTAAWSQNLKPIAQKISDAGNYNKFFLKTELFSVSNSTSKQRNQMRSIVTDATVMKFNTNVAKSIVSAKPEYLNFIIPKGNGGNMELELFRSNIFTPDFSVVTSGNNGQPVSYKGGLHYWGIIKGDNASLAAISIFDNEVMGIISSSSFNGNLVLGKIENNVTNDHILYNDRNLNATPGTDCFTPGDNGTYESRDLQNANRVLSNCIRLFWEVNFDIYTGKGSVANAANYVTGVFNQSAIIYANDAIPVELAEVFVWNTASPYTSTSTSGLLGQFQTYRNSINGDLGHLLGYAGGGGIAAGFSGFCASNLNSSQCYSGVQSSYSSVPTYSWTVMVVTHEQGHLMGSRHTHACVWNGNNTAIDGCGPAAGYGYEGSCSGAPIPPTGGTIMSYCHLNAVGINFNNGFGPQPKAVILNNYNSAACLSACIGTSCMPSANMSTANVLTTTATYKWFSVTGATGYNVRYRIVGNATWLTGATVAPDTVFNVTSLTPGSTYEWQVQTVCSGGTSIFTIAMTFTTTPLNCVTPTNLSTTNISSSTATFNWSAASGATGYNLRYRIVGTSTWSTGTSATTTFNASGLTASSPYEWQIQTTCSGGGTSSFSSSVNFTTLAPACNFPQNIFTTNIASSSATFNWNAVPGAVSYYVRYRIVGTSTWTTQPATGTSYNAIGLTPLSNYEWQIMTVCTGGQSAFSFSSLFTTLCATPAATITANGPITFCVGGNVLLTANSGPYTYQWLLNGSPIPGMVSMNYSANASGNYSVVVTSGTCSATSAVTTVTVNPLPAVTASDVSGCAGTLIPLSGTPAGGTWSVANPYTGPGTTYTHTYTDGNGCTNTSAAANITVNPLPTVSFSGLAASYNVTAPAATLTGSPTGGTFSGPGISGNIFTPSVAGIGGPYTINYSYTDGNGCSNSASQQTIVCTIPSMPGSITSIGGVAKMCPGDTKSYSITAVSGATSYTWTPPAGGVITTGQGTVQVTINYTSGFTASGTLRVVANNACGTGTARTLTINRNVPAKPSVITGQNNGLCNLSNIPYSVVNVAGITYSWSFNTAAAIVISGQGTNAISANYNSNFSSGTLQVTANNTCGTSAARSQSVKAVPATPAAISGPAVVCANQQGVPYSIAPVGNAISYTWTGMNGSHISDGVVTSTGKVLTTTSTSVTVNFGNTAGNLNVKANNPCGTGINKTLAIGFNCRESEHTGLSASGVNIFPNPASGTFTIQFLNKPSFPVRIEMTDVIGKVVERFETFDETIAMDESNLVKGIYYLSLKNNEGMIIKKISIVK